MKTKMNLQNFLKNKKVKYFLNILLILTVLFSFITTILISTLLNGSIQPEIIVILVASSILLLFNLVLSRFVKNKVLLLVINLVLCVSLIGSSIALFVNLQKNKVVDGYKTVSQAQIDLNLANQKILTIQTEINNLQFTIDSQASILETDKANISTYQKSMDYYIQTGVNLEKLENNVKILEEKYNNILIEYNKIPNPSITDTQYLSETSDAMITSQKKLNRFISIQQNLDNAIIQLQNDTEYINNAPAFLINANKEIINANYELNKATQELKIANNLKSEIKAIEAVSYTTAGISIVSGLTIGLTNLFI